MISRRSVAAGLVAGLLMNLGGGIALANRVGDTDACTPGYWKNHQENWEEYTGSTTLGRMLATSSTGPEYTFPAQLSSLQSKTMAEALKFRGGSDVMGAAQILLHHATAAFLNAAHEGLGYPYQRFGEGNLIDRVRTALESGDRDQMLALAAELDDKHNELECPF